MKKIYQTTLFLFPFIIYSQTHTFDWVRSLGSDVTESDGIYNVCTDKDNNIFTVGDFSGTVDFDPGVGITELTVEESHLFIQKLSPEGEFQWVKAIKYDHTLSFFRPQITSDANGNVYITSTFIGTIDADPGDGEYLLTSFPADLHDNFVLKLDPDGNFVWVKTLDNVDLQNGLELNRMIVGSNQKIYIAGNFRGTVDFDPDSGVEERSAMGEYENVYIMQWTVDGVLEWVRTLESTGLGDVNDITMDVHQDLILTGQFFYDVTDFDPGSGEVLKAPLDEFSTYLLKLTNNGDFIWVKFIEKQLNAVKVATDSKGAVVLTGTYGSTIYFDLGEEVYELSSEQYAAIFLLKLSSEGSFEWVIDYKGTLGYLFQLPVTDDYNNIYLASPFNGFIEVGPQDDKERIYSTGWTDIIVYCISETGQFRWVKTYETLKYDAPRAIIVDNNQNVILVGDYSIGLQNEDNHPIHFGDSPDEGWAQSTLGGNIFILKLGSCITTGIDVQSVGGPYQWIDGETYYEDNHTATHTLINAMGCDSVVTLNLNILNLGIDQQYMDNDLLVFPNPTTDKLTIRSVTPIEAIKLMDVNGKELPVTYLEYAKEEILLYLGEIPVGMYFLQVNFSSNDYRYLKITRTHSE